MPVGVAKNLTLASKIEGHTAGDFRRSWCERGLDAGLVGAVTVFVLLPPRMGLTVNWYAANPGFHPIPPGYGSPWGYVAGGVHPGVFPGV